MKNKKGFTLVELLAVVVVLSVISAIVIPSVYSMIKKAKDKSYNALIGSIESNAELYVEKHRSDVEDGLDSHNYYIFTLADLKDEALLQTPLNDPRTDKEINLSKEIIVTRSDDGTLSVCYEDRGCYIPTLLVNELTKEENIVSGTTEGLHYNSGSDIYYYMGANPNNWLKFNDYLWRIIRINSDGTLKLVFEGKSNGEGTNENGYISNGTFDNTNSNNYNSSLTIKNTLQSWYDLNITSSNKSKVDSRKYCIGQVGYITSGTPKETFWSTECGTLTTNNLSVGLIGGSDYLYASLDGNCLTSYKTTDDNGASCKNKNYLYKNYQYWTMTGDTTASGVWAVNQALGAPVSANTSSYIRPVITLIGGLIIDRGTGAFNNPYELKNMVNSDKEKPVITILGNNPVYIPVGGSYTDAGATATDNVDGDLTNSIMTLSNVDPNTIGSYSVTYVVSDSSGNKTTLSRIVNVLQAVYTYSYTGDSQTFTVPTTGTYKIELWGAQGGKASGTATGGYGSYSSGTTILDSGITIYIYIGGQGGASTSSTTRGTGGFNGGGLGGLGNTPGMGAGPGGGGATHMATSSGLLSSLSANQSAILAVAGGGGGYDWSTTGAGGGLGGGGGNGYGTVGNNATNINSGGGGGGGYYGTGGNGGGPNGGLGGTAYTAGSSAGSAGSFGLGGNGGGVSTVNTDGGGGGGGGYYGGGGGGGGCGGSSGGGGGGGSYIGSLTNSQTIAGNASMPSTSGGTETGHSGNGYAKITYIGS